MIVDMTAGYEMYSFMDGFSGYNQIKIAPADQEKITFTCAWGTFCWNAMPFGLNNVGATYQSYHHYVPCHDAHEHGRLYR